MPQPQPTNPVTTTSAPKQVLEQLEAADAAYEEVYGDGDGDDTPPVVQQEPAERPNGGVGKQPPRSAPAQANSQGGEDATWQQRYLTLQGKYNSEIPTLRQQLQDTQTALQQVRSQLAQNAAQPVQTPSQRPSGAPQNTSSNEPLVSDEEKAEYGDDFSSFVERVAQKAAERQTAHLKPTLDRVAGEVQQSRADSARGGLYAALDRRITNWREINAHPDFVTWLQTVDPLSGAARHGMLMQAFNAGDSARVIRFFETFMGEAGIAPEGQDPAPQSKPSRNQKINMAELATPRQLSPAGNRSAEPAPRQWTEADIKRFYADVRQGKVSAEKKARLETEIGNALRDGLVVPDSIPEQQ